MLVPALVEELHEAHATLDQPSREETVRRVRSRSARAIAIELVVAREQPVEERRVDIPDVEEPPTTADGAPTRWLFYTSGTTADPKGAPHTDLTVMASAVEVPAIDSERSTSAASGPAIIFICSTA